MDKKETAIEYFVKSLSTGERTAAQRLSACLASDVTYETNTQPGAVPIGRETFSGRDAVLEQVFGLWPATPGYARMGWSNPIANGKQWRVVTSGAVTLEFEFNDVDEISRVVLDGGYGSGASATPLPSGEVNEIPLIVKGMINNSLANQTPIVVTYVDNNGAPRSSLRGSVCVLGPTQIGIWARHADGGLPTSIATNPHVSLFYSDRRANAVINVLGRAHIAADDGTRRKVFELSPEVEQTHDQHRHGVAIVVDVIHMQANAGGGRGMYRLSGT